MGEAALLRDLHDGVLTLRLNRPAKLNAINAEISRPLLAELLAADASPDVRAVLIHGNGRAFCAGRDIGAVPTEDDLVQVQAVAEAIVRCSKPVLAAVHGWVVGAGLEWALCCDIVIAAADARFKLPEASLGVFVTGGISATLPALAGVSRAKALMLLGEPFTPAQALTWGLVWQVVAGGDLEATAQAMAHRLAALAPHVAQGFKRVLNQIGLPAFQQAIDLESATMRAWTPDLG